MRNFRWGSVVVAALLSVMACAGSNSGGSSSSGGVSGEIVIGVHTPLTGAASFVGQGFQLGTLMAVNEINAHGGVNGHKFKAIVENDSGTTDGGITAVRRLIDENHSFLIFGGGTSTTTVSVVPQMLDGPTPYYVSLASDPRVTEKYSDYVFSGATSTQRDVAGTIVKTILSFIKPKTVAIMQCDQAHCQSGVPLVKAGLEAAGVSVTTVQQYHSGDTDFTAQLDAIKKTNPDVVQVYGLAADGSRIIPQIRRAGIQGKIVGDSSLADPQVLKAAGPASEGFYAVWFGASQFIDDKTGAMGDWRDRFDKANPSPPSGTPNLYSTMGYADVYVVAEGIRRCGNNVTQRCFVDQLNTITDFVAGKDATFKYAAAIGLPRTFKKGEHLGNRTLAPIVAKNGVFTAPT